MKTKLEYKGKAALTGIISMLTSPATAAAELMVLEDVCFSERLRAALDLSRAGGAEGSKVAWIVEDIGLPEGVTMRWELHVMTGGVVLLEHHMTRGTVGKCGWVAGNDSGELEERDTDMAEKEYNRINTEAANLWANE